MDDLRGSTLLGRDIGRPRGRLAMMPHDPTNDLGPGLLKRPATHEQTQMTTRFRGNLDLVGARANQPSRSKQLLGRYNLIPLGSQQKKRYSHQTQIDAAAKRNELSPRQPIAFVQPFNNLQII